MYVLICTLKYVVLLGCLGRLGLPLAAMATTTTIMYKWLRVEGQPGHIIIQVYHLEKLYILEFCSVSYIVCAVGVYSMCMSVQKSYTLDVRGSLSLIEGVVMSFCLQNHNSSPRYHKKLYFHGLPATSLMSEIWTLFNPINKIYKAISFEKRGRKFKMCGTRERWVDLNMIRSVCVYVRLNPGSKSLWFM